MLIFNNSWNRYQVILNFNLQGNEVRCSMRIGNMPREKNPNFFIKKAARVELELDLSSAFYKWAKGE